MTNNQYYGSKKKKAGNVYTATLMNQTSFHTVG